MNLELISRTGSGQELDIETGLYNYGTRYYDPKISLFFGVDPMASKYPNHSPFTYTFNNPIRYNDPTGMEGEEGDKILDPVVVTAKNEQVKLDRTIKPLDIPKREIPILERSDDNGRSSNVNSHVIPLAIPSSFSSGTGASGIGFGGGSFVGALGLLGYGFYEISQGRNPVAGQGHYLGLTNPGLHPGFYNPNAVDMMWKVVSYKRINGNDAANKAARGWGYKDAHDLKKDHDVGSEYEIYRDGKTKKGQLRPRKGKPGEHKEIYPKN